eukprot:3172022-Pleurochrysis_carterae.AAC.7
MENETQVLLETSTRTRILDLLTASKSCLQFVNAQGLPPPAERVPDSAEACAQAERAPALDSAPPCDPAHPGAADRVRA